MGQTYGRVGCVDTLAAWSGRSEYIDFDLTRIDVEFDLLGFGQNRNGNRRGVYPPLCLGFRNTLNTMGTTFLFKTAERPFSMDHGDNLF